MGSKSPLVLVSNRGPVTFQPGGEVKRGTGGLVTALIGLASYRDATWIASAMTDEDLEQAERHDGEAFPVRAPDGGEYRVKLVASDPDAYATLALSLARDTMLRTALRAPGPGGLRHALQLSPLMDEATHAQKMDAALRQMWREWCKK